jgi:16S rRNA (guanine966-N2)-methyltransferase
VIDLFAGTGALGLEALSRGAARAVFVERDRENVGLIYRNIATLRYEDRTQVRHADAYRWAKTFQAVEDDPIVVLIDPPYREYEVRAVKLFVMLGQLMETLPKGSVVAIESGLTLDGGILPDFDLWDVRRYGSTQLAVRIVERTSEGSGENRLETDDDAANGGVVDE